MKYVGVGRRTVAFLIDAVILFVLAYIIALIVGGASSTGFELQGGPAFLTFILWFAYFVVLEATMGATLGKRAVGIRVVRADGCPITWSESLIRNALRIIDGILLYLVAAILVWQSPERQRLGDRIAHTYVVRAPASEMQAMCLGSSRA